MESMLTRVYRQITTIDSGAQVTIATSKKQVCAIKNQLGEKVSICMEPDRRDTFPAICLAASYLHDVQGVSEKEAVVVCPDGNLIADKEQSSYMKPYVEKMEQQVMYAEKSWGSFNVLDVQDNNMTIKITLLPGHMLHYHSHEHRDEV